MAIYRTVQMTFWTDTKVIDDFTPEDRYFYLYLMTNPHTNLAGCYELSMSTMANETGYSKEVIEKLIARMENTHDVIRYSTLTKEILILNWNKYNWTSSPKFKQPLLKEIETIKNTEFKRFLHDLAYGIDTVSIPYRYPIDTTVTVTDIDNNKPLSSPKSKPLENDIPKLLQESEIERSVKEKISEWLTYKTERKEGYKTQGFKSLLSVVQKNVDKYGADAVCEVIDLSMSNQWQGILWKRLEETNNKPRESAYMQAIKDRVNIVDTWT